jgi:HK97 family phage prohead protease/HK97 family phage major capsid protein
MAKVGGEEISLTPTDSMASEAQRGLDWREDGFDGGTPIGLARARQLVNRQELSPSTVRRMHSFFSRHEVDKQGEGFSPGEPGYPSNGRVAWALWGGDAGQTWARAKSATLDRLEGKSIDYTKEFSEDFGSSCPAVTHDELLNVQNHLVTIQEANLGPADPTAPENEFWANMAETWSMSEQEARARQCQNCEYYKNSPKIIDCLNSSEFKASMLPVEPKWADTDPVSGYCTKFDITCSARRTCSEWDKQKFMPEDEDEEGQDESSMMELSARGKAMNKIFKLDSSIKSIKEDEDELKITGYASTNAMDRSCDRILPTAWTKGGLKNFKTNPILLFNHNYDKPIGKVIAMGTDSKGLQIKGVISKSAGDVYNLVKEGVLSTFSVGFLIKDAEYDKQVDGLVVKDAELLEVSVVSVPCNQDATFSVAKSFDNQDDYLKFKQQFFDNALGGQPLAEETRGSSEDAAKEKASRKLTMDEQNDMIQKAVAAALEASDKARAEKAAAEQAEKKAAEEMEAKVATATAKVLASSEEKLYAELEKRFQDKEVNLEKALEGLRGELAEKSVELQAISQSKRVFSDRNDNGSWKKTFAPDMENAYLLGRITKKGYDTNFGRSLLEKVNAHSSVQVSSADFEQEVSSNIERDIQNELILAPMFREIAMNTASMILPIMPDSGYAEITGNAGSTDATNPNGTLESRGGTNRGGIALSEVELRTVKMVAKSYLGNETEEDAILPILPLLREAMIRSHARGVENMILLGGHADGAYSSITAASGLLKYASSSSRDVAAAGTATALTAAALLGLRKQMGKYGLRANDVAYIVSQQCYFELLEDAEFQDFNLVNTQATKLTGEVGQVFGSAVMVCDEFPTAAAGKYHALAVNKRNFVIPRQRGVTVESDYLVEDQHRVLVTSQRLGFKEIIPGAKSVIGLKYAAS